MPVKRKRKVDPQEIRTVYVFDLRRSYSWSGELSYHVGTRLIAHIQREEFSSIPTLIFEADIAETNSKKVNSGDKAKITIFIKDSGKPEKLIGLIEKKGPEVEIALWLPWQIANHVHLVLMSQQAQRLEISGTELYRRSGKVDGLRIWKDFDQGC